MSDYISREAAIREIVKNAVKHAEDPDITDDMVHAVQCLPAADVRPVVLCRDCDMYECHEYDGGFKYVCRLFKRQMQEADFCSYGEKKEES